MTNTLVKRIRSAVGGEKLGKPYYQFLMVHTGFSIFTGLPSVFINTFLMSRTNRIDVVLVYNCLSFAGTAAGMLLSAGAVHRFQSGIVSVMGIIGFNLLYFELMFFNAQAARYVLLLGITNGLAGAFYWMSYSQLFTEFTGLGNRDSGLAIISIMTSTVNLAAPLIAGAIITVVGGMSGYNVVFRIAFAIGIITAAAYMWLPKPETSKGRARHKLTYRYVHIHKAIFWSLISECFKGIREGAFSFILTVMLYQMIQSEMLAGVNTFLASGASILSFLIISRRIKIANRLKYMETSVFCLFLFGIIVIFYINPVILMIFTVINAFFSGFITNSSFNTFLDSIQTFPDMNNFRPELFAEKEMYLAAGRCIGIFIIIFLDRISGGDFAWQAVSLIVLTLTQVGTLAACGHSMQLIKKASIARCGR